MREIKFRAWDSTHNAMNYKVCVGNTQLDDENYTCSTILINGEWLHFDDYKKIVTMQYTGLKDKNGVEIYEGDVVRSFSNINKKSDPHLSAAEPTYRTSSVEFYDGAFRLTCDEFPHGCGILNNYVGAMAEDLEVIGNIYENPELLETEL